MQVFLAVARPSLETWRVADDTTEIAVVQPVDDGVLLAQARQLGGIVRTVDMRTDREGITLRGRF
jgi:hypothetical protein